VQVEIAQHRRSVVTGGQPFDGEHRPGVHDPSLDGAGVLAPVCASRSAAPR
jgi:hypothetical protein